jgi:hypothetical protein
MSESASQLISNYFVASRRARSTGGSTEECLPIGAVQNMYVFKENYFAPSTLKIYRSIMAEAHARLSLRSEITREDALVAISLYEQSMVSLFGPAFQAPPPPLSGASLTSYNAKESVDDYMRAMGQWLENFLSALIGVK